MTNALVPYSEKRAAAAAAYATQTRGSANLGADRISLKGGMFTLGEDNLGDQLCVIVANSIWVNTYFAEEYQEGVKSAPTCYAYGRTLEEMAPHQSMAEHPDQFIPQSVDCASCEMNKFGTARKGRGKACGNRELLALIHGGDYVPVRKGSRDLVLDAVDPTQPDGLKHYQDSECFMLSLPVTSVGNWAAYVNKLAALGQPIFGVLTRVYIVKDTKNQYEVHFEMIEAIPDGEPYDVLAKRHESLGPDANGHGPMAQAFSPPLEENERERRGGVKGLVRR